MKELFLALAVLESWLLTFFVLALLGGRYDGCLALAEWVIATGLIAALVYRRLEVQPKCRRWTEERA